MVSIVHNAIHSAAWEVEMFTCDRTTICYAIKYQSGARRIARKLRADRPWDQSDISLAFPYGCVYTVFSLFDRSVCWGSGQLSAVSSNGTIMASWYGSS